MRKIKFRVYLKGHWAEKEYGTMLYDYQDTILSESEGFIETDDFKIMQFTGLKDENGKEIYEGDIILKFIKGNIEIKFNPFEVKWHPITCGWNITAKTGHYYEKIGNIYENSELLND